MARWGGVTPVLVVALAAVMALAVPPWTMWLQLRDPRGSGESWTAYRQAGTPPPAGADRDLAAFRAILRTGEHVGWIVPRRQREFMSREAELQRFYSAQYALAPAVLKPIYLPDCLSRSAWACGLGRADLVLFGPGGELPTRIVDEFGFVPVLRENGLTLARRSR